MADRSLFGNLKRLFSTDIIIRNVGGNTLKVADTNNILQYGGIETNRLVDRFTRLHSPYHTLMYTPMLNYQTLRLQLYSDYEGMDTDAIIASALDVVADEATLKDEYGKMLTIQSEDDNIKRILNNLFYDVLNIEFNLNSWVRNMCKYGDFYLKLEIAEKFGIYKVIPLSVYEMIREEGENPNGTSYVKFKLDPGATAGGQQSRIDPGRFGGKVEFDNYEVAHFRLLTDSNFLPYGRSYLEPARKLFKQYTLMEDAMLIHRIMRAPEKRTFFINVGNIPPNEVDSYMNKMMQSIKKTPYIDQQTGNYNLKYNLQNMIEDFYIPVRNGDSATKIDTTKGLDYDGTNDIEYLRNKLLAALKVPKAYLGYDENLQGKSTLAAQDIRFARTIEKVQRIIESELTKIALVHLYVQGYDGADLVNFDLKLTNPSIVFEQEKIELYNSKVNLANEILDKNLFSADWIYKNIFNLSDQELETEREKGVKDKLYQFRLNQIESEGNDPVETGKVFGTPHSLAALYKKEDPESRIPQNLPTDAKFNYNEREPKNVGRPKDISRDMSWDGNFSRDRLGKTGLESPSLSSTQYKVRSLALEKLGDELKKSKKKTLTEKKDLLDESNLDG